MRRGQEQVEVAPVARLVGVDERQVDVGFVGKFGEAVGGRADPHLDPVVDTGGGPRLARRRQVLVGDVEADEPPAVAAGPAPARVPTSR